MMKVNQVELPALMKMSKGSRAIAPVGDMLDTDCASTSHMLSAFRRSVVAPAASAVGVSGSPADGVPGEAVSVTFPPLRSVMAVWMLALLADGHVEPRVAVEEAERLELEPDVHDRHHRPVLGPHDVVGAEDVPDDQVRVLQVPVGGHVSRQAVSARVLVGVVAGREVLIPVIRRDPEVPGGEARAPDGVGLRLVEGQHVVAWLQLVGDRLLDCVQHRGICDLPVASSQRVDDTLRLRLSPQQRRLHDPRIAVRIVWAGRYGLRIALIDRVAGPIHHHVQAHTEEVLVVRSVQARSHQRTVLGLLADGQRTRRSHAGQLDLVLDRAVLVEVPEVAVLVVTDGGNRGKHQPARAPDLRLVGPKVGVLPEDPVVLFVHADRVLDRLRLAVVVVDDGVEVMDLPQAVAAELQTVAEHAHAVLAHVEDVLAIVRRPDVAVGDEHLSERSAVDDRPQAVTVLVADRVQHKALARREADAKAPLLPAHLVAVDPEAGALWLKDLDQLLISPRPCGKVRRVVGVGDPLGRVVAASWRERHDALVLDFDDLHTVEVEAHDEALDRPGVSVVVGITLTHERQRPYQPALVAGVLWTVVAKRPGVDHHVLEVGHPPPAHGLLPAGVVAYRLLCGDELLEHDRRLDAWTLPPGAHFARRDGYHRLESLVLGTLPQDHERLAVNGLPGLEAQDCRLARFVERDEDEACGAGQVALGPQDLGSSLYLFCSERVQRVPRGRDG